MKVAVIVARVILGLIYTLFSLAFFFNLMPQQEMTGPAGQFVMGLGAAGYMMPVIKSLELICGVALLSGRFVALANVIIFPITLNILLFHLFLMPEGMLMPVVMLAANLFLAFAYWERYKVMVAVK